MSDSVKYVLGLVTGIIVILVIWLAGYHWGKTSQKDKDIITQTEYVYQIDSLKNVIENIYSASTDYTHRCDSLELELNLLSRKSQKLKEDYDAKISNTTVCTNAELQRFFTERYSR